MSSGFAAVPNGGPHLGVLLTRSVSDGILSWADLARAPPIQMTDFPASPARTARTAQVVGPPTNPTDIGRAIDLFVNHLNYDQRIHPADFAELMQLSTTIKASSNNL
jgi:hypothetical protein